MAHGVEKFSDRARKALSRAQEEAARRNHRFIGTEHVLLGLVLETGGVAAKILSTLGIDGSKLRIAVDDHIGHGESAGSAEIGLTPRAKKVIELAVDEARLLNHRHIGTEHLLIGLMREGKGVAADVLGGMGVTLESVRAEMARVLAQPVQHFHSSGRFGGPRTPTLWPASQRHQSLNDYMASAWSGKERYDGLDAVIGAIADGALQLQPQVQAAALGGMLGATGEINVQGEIVQRLDKAGSDIFVDVLRKSGRVAAIGSEEIDKPVIAGDDDQHRYIVLMDPLDGSSNIDVAVSVGSIFGVWRREGEAAVNESLLLRPGSEQVAAAYVIYGSSTILVVATENSVQGFTLSAPSGEFALTHHNIQIPEKCEYYSTNEGNRGKWDEATQRAVGNLRDTYSLRYVGSLVADFHRNLLKGGIFLYPGDRSSPDGKLRLMYEANPLGFVAEQAGGATSSGSQRILDIQPEKLHQRTPLILGNKAVVEQTVSAISGA